MDFKDSFKKNLKTAKKGLEVSSSPSSLFESLSAELQSEMESNKILKFKSNLRETLKTVKEESKTSSFNIFDRLPKPETVEEELIQEDIIQTLDIIEEKTNIEKNLILDAVESISKEQTLKSNEQIPENYTNTVSQPNSAQPNPDIKSLQKKLKFLEDWVSKISMAGPGGGEVNLRYLDDVDRSTIGHGKYLNYNATTKKFQFSTLSGGGAPQVQSDWDETDNTEPAFIKNKPTLFSGSYTDLTDKPSLFSGSYDDLTDKPSIPSSQVNSDWDAVSGIEQILNKPTLLSEFTNDLSQISWTNSSPSPAENFKTIIGANDGAATITFIDGVPGFGSSVTWTIDETKITFPDATQQTTAWLGTYSYNDLTDTPSLFSGSYNDLTDKPTIPAAQIQSDWNQTDNAALDYIKNKPAIPDVTKYDDVLAVTGEPMGHEDKTQSTISFNAGTRTFTIAPVGSFFEVWVKGTKHTFTTTQTVTLPNTTGEYYIYFDENGLGAQTSFFVWDQQAPTSLIYYNAVTGLAPYFADERHGTTLDWQTHEYLHRTRGAVIANGFAIGNYTVGGAVQVDIGNGTFFDEDLQIDIVHSNTPTANTWEQDLQGPAQIPMFYLSGTGWVRDNPTGYLNKQGTSRPRYNLLSGGTWSVADIDNNKYGTTFIVATNNLTYPIIGIMSQSAHANQGDAEALEFSDLVLTGFPVAEFRLLYKVVFKADSTHGTLTSVWDLRQLSATTPSAAVGSDHGLLSGLGDDDHPQYLLRTAAATVATTGSANDLTGTTLKSTVVSSSLKSVGTIEVGVWNGTKISNDYIANPSVTINDTTIQLGQTTTITADARYLTSSYLNASVTGSSLTSVGTLTNLTVAGEASPTAGVESTHYLNVGTHGHMFDDGNFHLHSTSGDMWFNTLESGRYVQLNTQGVSAGVKMGGDVISTTPFQGKTPYNSALNTEVTVDNFRFRVGNPGNGTFPQIISNTSGTVDICWAIVGVVSGAGSNSNENSGVLIPNNSWTTLYSSHGMDNRGDTLTAHVTDKNAGRIYRVTFLVTNNASNTTGYNIVVERII